jgi:hypothetical protein
VPTNRSANKFARGDRTGVLITRVPFPAKTPSKTAVNLLSRSRSKNLTQLALAEFHQQIPSLLGRPGPGWIRGDAQDVHSPALDLHHEQHVHALQQDGADVQEITRQDPGCLSGQELPPRRRRTARRGPEPGSGQDPADRSLSDSVPQPR